MMACRVENVSLITRLLQITHPSTRINRRDGLGRSCLHYLAMDCFRPSMHGKVQQIVTPLVDAGISLDWKTVFKGKKTAADYFRINKYPLMELHSATVIVK